MRRLKNVDYTKKGNVESRNSKDEILNAEESKLLGLCEAVGRVIKNGDTTGDWDG